jgi:hypothetical protein
MAVNRYAQASAGEEESLEKRMKTENVLAATTTLRKQEKAA